MSAQRPTAAPRVAIIGTGFGGLGMAYSLKTAGLDDFTIYEKAADVGGVWRENTYPGAACDVPSHLYSFSFEPHYPWAYRYGKQAEIHAYLRHVADKYDLRRHIVFGKQMNAAEFDEASGEWVLQFADGEVTRANVLITAVGQLHRPQIPAIEGIEHFDGRVFHSANWEHDFDYAGKTIAAIGTGPSAVQFVPELAKSAKQLYVFQRSPGWCIPKFDRRFNVVERALLKYVPPVHDLDRGRIFWFIEFLASALQRKALLAAPARGLFNVLARWLMRFQVKDPALQKKLTPDFAVGCKRTLLSNEWLPALAQSNVEVVTEGVTRATADGVVSSDGRERKVDAIVYGTGFASTQFLAPMRVQGIGGQLLSDTWSRRAAAHLGMAVSGFPNLFVIYGPNTNLGAGSIIYMLERQQRYIVQAVALLRDRGLRWLDVKPEVQDAFVAEIDRRSGELVYTEGCHSWYLTDGINTNNWVGYMSEYGRRLKQLQVEDYRLAPTGTTVLSAAA